MVFGDHQVVEAMFYQVCSQVCNRVLTDWILDMLPQSDGRGCALTGV